MINGLDPGDMSSEELGSQLPDSSGQMVSQMAKDLGDGSPYARKHKERMSEKTGDGSQV